MFIPSNPFLFFFVVPFLEDDEPTPFFSGEKQKSDRPPPSRPQGEGVKVLACHTATPLYKNSYFFDLHTRVRILKSSISDLRTRVNIARAGHRIITPALGDCAIFAYKCLLLRNI